MLTKKDYQGYLDQIGALELEMSRTYENFASQVDDLELRELFKTLSLQEKEHYGIVQQIAQLLNSDQ